MDSFSETTSTSWFSRLIGSIKSVVVGLAMFVVAFPVLFWNEGRAVRTARSLDEGAGAVISVPADRVDAANEGKLVHVSASSDTAAPVRDEEFGVEQKAVKLLRKVEMYQWKEESRTETRKKLGGGEERVTTYDYKKDWSDEAIDSSSFKKTEGHQNPGEMPVPSREFVAGKVTVGAFTLSAAQVAKLDRTESLRMDAAAAEAVPGELAGRMKAHDGRLYLAENPGSPVVGDVRVSFSVVRPGPVSLVAKQIRDTFEPYHAKAGDDILLVKESTLSADAMFQAAQDENTLLTWILRGVGFFVMFFGLLMLFRPFTVFADVIPLFGTLLGAGLGVFSFLLAVVLSITTIAVAWVFYRPLLGVGLFLMAGLALFGLVRLGMKRKQERLATPAAAA